MDKPKRPPPVPKFQDKNDKADLEKKLDSFINSISQPQPQPPPQNQSKTLSQPTVKSDVSPKDDSAGKKKLTLASLNSKLNNMLSAKKIAITTAISAEVEKEKKEEQRKIIQIEYDPQHPNSYQLSKHTYAAQLAALVSDEQEEEEDQKVIEQQPQEETQMIQQQWQPQEKEQIALRMMQKFGYKVGEGLGKQGQGIRTPLIVRKTTDSSGIIEQSTIPLNYLIPPEVSAKNALAAHSVQPSEVLVLVGVISMEELQEGLQEEIKQECCLYGVVCDWLLFLYEGQLRIFVQFQSREQALNAFIKMNGKYFGERLVSVRSYPLQMFKDRVLSEALHAHVPT